MSGPQVGLGSVAATRDAGQIRQKANHLEQLNGRVRTACHELETFRARVSGFYEEAPIKTNEEVSQECRTDLDELQCQLHQLEAGLERLDEHIREIQNI